MLRFAGKAKRAQRGRLTLDAAILWFAVSYGLTIIGYLVINAVAARMLGSGFGYFVIAMTVSTLLGQLGLVGVHRGGLREAARMAPNDEQVLAGLRRSVRAISLLMLPATAVVSGVATYFMLAGSDATGRWAVAVGIAALVYLSGQQKLWANYLRGFGQVRFASLLEGRSGGALASGLQAVLLGLVFWLRPGWGLPAALGALAVGYAVPVILAWRQVHLLWRHLDPRGSLWADLVVAVRRYWRFASNLLSGYLNTTVEIWFAAFVLSSSQLSLFSAAQRLSVLLAVPLVSLGVVYSPVVSRLVGHDDMRLQRLLRTGSTFAICLTSVAWVPMLIAPGQILGLVYGDAFSAAAAVLVLLTIGSFANVWSGMCGTALAMSQHESSVAVVQWIAVAARLIIGPLAAVSFGIVGLGASSAVITAILYLTLWWITRRRMHLWTHPTFRPSIRLLRQTAG